MSTNAPRAKKKAMSSQGVFRVWRVDARFLRLTPQANMEAMEAPRALWMVSSTGWAWELPWSKGAQGVAIGSSQASGQDPGRGLLRCARFVFGWRQLGSSGGSAHLGKHKRTKEASPSSRVLPGPPWSSGPCAFLLGLEGYVRVPEPPGAGRQSGHEVPGD